MIYSGFEDPACMCVLDYKYVLKLLSKHFLFYVLLQQELLDMLNVPDEFLDFPVKERDILNIYQKSENYGLYFPCECDNQEIKSVINLSDGTSLDNLITEENSNTDLVSDSVVIEKIQEAEHQARETGNLIKDLKEKQRILLHVNIFVLYLLI